MTVAYPYYYLIYKPKGSTQSQCFLQYAEVHKNAVQTLFKEYLREPPRDVSSSAPILYLLRQYIELQLKGIIKWIEPSYKIKSGKKGHDIIDLYDKAQKVIDERYGLAQLGQANQDCEKFIKSLGKVDATVGRYPETIDEKEFKIDEWLQMKVRTLTDFKDIAEKVIKDLERMEGYVESKKNNEQENWANQERP
jgi:hypothetical protein